MSKPMEAGPRQTLLQIILDILQPNVTRRQAIMFDLCLPLAKRLAYLINAALSGCSHSHSHCNLCRAAVHMKDTDTARQGHGLSLEDAGFC